MKVAILYQELDPPIINGTSKPKKPSGYKDSGADIAYNLFRASTSIITPVPNPDPTNDADWTFPDTESGILSAIEHGATHLWANTIFFSTHPLQTSPLLDRYASTLLVIGQAPNLVSAYDDKNLVNSYLRTRPAEFTMPVGTLCPAFPSTASASEVDEMLAAHLKESGLDFPLVAKPIRGRGSQGVRVIRSLSELGPHVASLGGSSNVMLEEFLPGTEGTVTVVSEAVEGSDGSGDAAERVYRALPVVIRTGHHDDVAPYNGLVAVSANSRVVTKEEVEAEKDVYARVAKECEDVARVLDARAPIRIDVRRRAGEGGRFVLFDVNPKPNFTLVGRPGRDDQACLVALAAEGYGWDNARLLEEILKSATPLDQLRAMQVPADIARFGAAAEKRI